MATCVCFDLDADALHMSWALMGGCVVKLTRTMAAFGEVVTATTSTFNEWNEAWERKRIHERVRQWQGCWIL